MPEPLHHLHATGGREWGVSRRPGPRRPGPAVVFILLYAVVFAAVLWVLRARSPIFRTRRAAMPAPRATKTEEAVPRSVLLSGPGLTPLARDEYFRQISAACCPCGCDLNLRDCLVADQVCQKSPVLARAVLDSLR